MSHIICCQLVLSLFQVWYDIIERQSFLCGSLLDFAIRFFCPASFWVSFWLGVLVDMRGKRAMSLEI